tara:strand:+ start:752 stop:2242 length:1491 start_codon:yes stop_codon:yes gene_type:complete
MAVRAGDLPLEVGKRALLRGGGAMGIAGLLAMDPFDSGDEVKVVAPTTKIENTNAMIEDRSKEYPGYDWLNDELPVEGDLRELAEYRADAGYDDFQDRSNQAWIGREDFPYTDEERDLREFEEERFAEEEAMRIATMNMSSGGIVGLYNGGRIPGYQAGAAVGLDPDDPIREDADPSRRASRHVFDIGKFGRWLTRLPDAQLARIDAAGHDPALLANEPGLRGHVETERNRLRRIVDEGGEIPENVAIPPELWADGKPEIVEEGPSEEETPEEGIPDIDIDRGPSATEVGGNAAERWFDAQAARNKRGRTETPEEAALRRRMGQHAATAEGDAKTRLLMDVSMALRPGQDITEGLNRATEGQMALRDKAAAFRDLPLTMAAERSRFDEGDTDRIFENIFQAAASRGDLDARIAGELEAAYAQIDQRGELTPDGLLALDQIMRNLVEDKKMEPEERASYMDALTKQVIGRLSGASRGRGSTAGGIGVGGSPAARGVV